MKIAKWWNRGTGKWVQEMFPRSPASVLSELRDKAAIVRLKTSDHGQRAAINALEEAVIKLYGPAGYDFVCGLSGSPSERADAIAAWYPAQDVPDEAITE